MLFAAQFATLRGGSEKERLVPVLTTMLKLSPEEQKELQTVVSGESQADAAAGSGWGGLPATLAWICGMIPSCNVAFKELCIKVVYHTRSVTLRKNAVQLFY